MNENNLPKMVLLICKKRGWTLNHEGRGFHLHQESSELMEAIRGKHGNPVDEAADVLFVLMSITENHGISWEDVIASLNNKINTLETRQLYSSEIVNT